MWLWSYGSWIYNYLCYQCLSPLKLWVRIPPRRGVLDTSLCDKVCQWFAAGRWFSPGTLVSPTNKTDCHDITEILLKVAQNTINHKPVYKQSGARCNHTHCMYINTKGGPRCIYNHYISCEGQFNYLLF